MRLGRGLGKCIPSLSVGRARAIARRPAKSVGNDAILLIRTTMNNRNNFPKLHNAAWPGVVGKGGDGPDDEPPIALETMLDLTANAEVDGRKFDGVDLFLSEPHIGIDSTDDEL